MLKLYYCYAYTRYGGSRHQLINVNKLDSLCHELVDSLPDVAYKGAGSTTIESMTKCRLILVSHVL